MNKVQVYWNSHKKLFSVRYNHKIIAWERKFCVFKAKFIVSEKGRQRVLREKRKSVHAWVEGSIDSKDSPDFKNQNFDVIQKHPIYNPFKHESFVDKFSYPKDKIDKSDMVIFETVNNKPFLTSYDYYEQKPFVISIGICAALTT